MDAHESLLLMMIDVRYTMLDTVRVLVPQGCRFEDVISTVRGTMGQMCYRCRTDAVKARTNVVQTRADNVQQCSDPYRLVPSPY